jgi:glycosyltransferase involved in cell wall biosynthesis
MTSPNDEVLISKIRMVRRIGQVSHFQRLRIVSLAQISAVIIAKNAASQLPDCLTSLGFCAEVVVVDSGSTDSTQSVVQSHGARLIEAEWIGFGPMKQFAVEQARYDWVLCVDADEQVSLDLRASLQTLFNEVSSLEASPRSPQMKFPAYRFPRRNRFLGDYLTHGEGYPDWSLRFFDRRQARWSDDLVHEKVLVQGEIGTLDGDLLHHSAESLEDYLAKQNRYSSIAAQTAVQLGRRASIAQLLLSPAVRFAKFYLLRRGFLDGTAGLVHILIGCWASFAKYAKMLDIQRQQARTQKKPE